ncbi:hypothetical protein [Halopiger xanaduensis]|uniref:Uncharacterized protein n=1 Tax=Halopiger xanaduensis (strain DSM 18323 / JCM 14033 / SH-6) TaxID=797210 RepID=F8DBZ2_HALXS|nr:hypothetical protein [Halopiger xanaduensis]AEH35968.1 hypothetical protein Halxa_1335 [Halopiger xanaduensis SH-6]
MDANRRQYLARTGAVLGTAALAGCLDALDGDEGSDVDVEDRTGPRELDRAVGQLNRAALALNVDEGALENPEEVDFDASEPRDHLEQAREHLSTAESELDGREDDLEALRTYAGVLETLTDVTATVADDALLEDVERVNTALESDGENLDEAVTTVEDRRATLESTQSAFDAATSELVSLDADRLQELAVIDRAELESGASTLGDVLDSQVTLATGYETLLGGYEYIEQGRAKADDGNHEDAEMAFTAAKQEFATAAETFSSGKEDAPKGLVDYFATALCQSGHLESAAGSFADAAAAATERDPVAARQHREEAEASLEDARACAD